jgi:hypothetical protein
MKIEKYKLVECTTKYDFNLEVNKAIQEGFELLGSFTFTPVVLGETPNIYRQELVKYKEDKNFEPKKYVIEQKRYVVVCWPDSQDFMEHERYHECHLINDEDGLEEFGSSAYFVPEDLYCEINK